VSGAARLIPSRRISLTGGFNKKLFAEGMSYFSLDQASGIRMLGLPAHKSGTQCH
jgi:hypothetical protein